ncbi:MAG: hypothetical protein RLZZ309_1008, partial [Bacteroidota bacterium]
LSDYYIVIVAGLFGTKYPGSDSSWTQKEYEYAIEKGVPVASQP